MSATSTSTTPDSGTSVDPTIGAPAPTPGSEKADLLAELAEARRVLVQATEGLDDTAIARRTTVSALTLGGLVKHVARTEAAWLRFVLEGPSAMPFDLPDGVTWEALLAGTAPTLPQWLVERLDGFTVGEGETLASILAEYAAVAARTEEIVRSLPDLSAGHPLPAAPWNEPGAVHSARRVLIHVIAETCQHAGHADILRESLDGRTAT